MIELASVVELAVIALAMADASAGVSIAATAEADAVAGGSLPWLGWMELIVMSLYGWLAIYAAIVACLALH